MLLTDYQAKFYAAELTRRFPSDSADRLAGALVDAQVDLNPHQVDAALFAFQSPLSKGAILADEVGLGKTIEAGLVLAQRWAERKRRLLVITPSNLRKQWFQELSEKFFLPCRILEARPYNEAVRQGHLAPFEQPEIVICSYQFARNKASDVARVPWDLVVIDEAHRLRNVYKPSNIIANTLKAALGNAPKLLLTATPLQNSLLELFGLVSFIDDHAFGDLKSFREQFTGADPDAVYRVLRARLRPLCHRTLRRQVVQYVPYTNRLPIVQPFSPDDAEDRLYHLVSDYLRRPNLQALPSRQRTLMTLVMRKLLASSTFAIAGALGSLIERLQAKLGPGAPDGGGEVLGDDYEALDSTADEWPEDEAPVAPLGAEERAAVEREVADLDEFRRLALSISTNAKGKALVTALERAFAEADRLGASRKAIIFTESRRTQDYLLRVLAESPFREGIVLFNGSNTDPRSREIYAAWLERHQGTDRVTGSRTADMRSALVDYFRDDGRIMIATEAGAEGINLQFCALVVNYDLPWNPQRIEQRIGRCHRYGQKHDVVVVNFLNQKNEADQRVFQLLSEKFRLFEGVFGASDEVLGALESGVDFERRIASIYQQCRRPDEITTAFNALQLDLGLEIDQAMTRTRQQLLENFDDEVREKLRTRDAASRAQLSRFEDLLMKVTRHELRDHAVFTGEAAFDLVASPFGPDLPLGRYELPRRTGDAHLYRLGHPLALRVVERAGGRLLLDGGITFRYADHEGRISVLEPLVGSRGWLTVARLTLESFDQAEDHLILTGITESGDELDDDAVRRLLTVPGAPAPASGDVPAALDGLVQTRREAVEAEHAERAGQYFDAEVSKLDSWADDLKLSLERRIKDLERELAEARRASRAKASLDAKLEALKRVKELEAKRAQLRRSLFDAQDEIDGNRERLIADVEAKLTRHASLERLFTVAWSLQ